MDQGVKSPKEQFTFEPKLKYPGQLEIIQERDSEQLDVDQFHQKILEQARRISNFNPDWCHTISEGNSSQRKLSSKHFQRTNRDHMDTPKSNLSNHQANKKLFFESFKNQFSIESSRRHLDSQQSQNKNVTSMKRDSNFSLKDHSKDVLKVESESQNDETREVSKDQAMLMKKFQEKLLESKRETHLT
jgi:hypothetical protein